MPSRFQKRLHSAVLAPQCRSYCICAGLRGDAMDVLHAEAEASQGIGDDQHEGQTWAPEVLASLLQQAARAAGIISADGGGECLHGSPSTICQLLHTVAVGSNAQQVAAVARLLHDKC